jgi:hypothetical protein
MSRVIGRLVQQERKPAPLVCGQRRRPVNNRADPLRELLGYQFGDFVILAAQARLESSLARGGRPVRVPHNVKFATPREQSGRASSADGT